MIQSFADGDTEKIWNRQRRRRFDAIARAALIRLEAIDAATTLNDLRVPPGNRLEALSGDREGQHSIRINRQWRVCFVWRQDGAHDVEIADYH